MERELSLGAEARLVDRSAEREGGRRGSCSSETACRQSHTGWLCTFDGPCGVCVCRGGEDGPARVAIQRLPAGLHEPRRDERRRRRIRAPNVIAPERRREFARRLDPYLLGDQRRGVRILAAIEKHFPF